MSGSGPEGDPTADDDLPSDAFIVYDLTGSIHDANAMACSLLGYTRDRLLTLSMADLRPDVPLQRLQLIWGGIATNGGVEPSFPGCARTVAQSTSW